MHPEIRLNFAPFNTKEFYSHVSNCIISCDLFATIALIWLVTGVSNKAVILLGITIILLNLFVERFVTILNTPDIADACYGIAGVILAGIFITIIKLFGLKVYQFKNKY